jgi:hypothetical protein
MQWIPGALSPGEKLQGREADHSPPASAEIKRMWIYTSTPPYAFMTWCLITYSQETTSEAVEETCIMRSFIICSFHQLSLGYKDKEEEKDRICSTHGG